MNGTLLGGFGACFLTGAWLSVIADLLPTAVVALIVLLALACCVAAMVVTED